jgi:glutamyl/glutaminyl-tRNA synthetase
MIRVCQRLQVYVVVVIPQSHCAISVSVLVLAKMTAWLILAYLEFCVRNHLENTAPRAMAVLNPLKVVITNVG